jgi:hypothetical protein
LNACLRVRFREEELVPVCDGCGGRVDEEHIRRRIERLEMATCWRPIHINVLLIDAAPPARAEDFFYGTGDQSARSADGERYFEALAKLTGLAAGANAGTETVLAEFQRRGFFLTSAMECAAGDAEELNAAVRRLAATVLRRVQTSYKPKNVALISGATRELIEPFKAAGWGDRLILDESAPFAVESIGERLAGTLAKT